MLLSALDNASVKVCIQTSSGKQIEVLKSTPTETNWYILEEGSQFTYAAVRCSVEFDYDNSISNSMRPPKLPGSTEDTSTFDDTEMLQDRDIADNTVAIAESVPEEPDNTKKLSEACQYDNPVVERQTTPVDGAAHDYLNASIDAVFDAIAQTKNVVSTSEKDSHTTNSQRTLLTDPDEPAANVIPSESSEHLGLLATKRISQKDNKRPQTVTPPAIASFFQSNEPKAVRFADRFDINDPPALSPQHKGSPKVVRHVHTVPRSHDVMPMQHTSEQSDPTKTATPGTFARRPGEESQLLRDPVDIIATRSAPRPRSTSDQYSRRRAPGEESQTLETPASRRIASGEHIRNAKVQRVPLSSIKNISAASGHLPRNSKKQSVRETTTTPVPTSQIASISANDPPRIPKRSRPTTPEIPNKHNFSVSTPSSFISNTTTAASSEYESGTSDGETITVSIAPKRKVKRRRILRGEREVSEILKSPTIVFSSTCVVQNKKKTMQSFSELGGKITDNISHADILCTPASGEIKKTPKLILAIVLGKMIVTEEWVVDCTRRNRILDPGAYLPRDKARETEWNFKLSEAVKRGRAVNGEVTRIFEDDTFFLTPQLRDQLHRTKNLEGFEKICRAMGAKQVRSRIPVKFGPQMIVLGVSNDIDRKAVLGMGFPLYDKDLLTMSALRGERQDDTNEFKVEIPIKEEESL